ncbi:MAG: cytochrome c class I [Verrucomicrobiales bacterium]|nr:cytochrome c class I [Verrucomicrobiales bacterium]|tara:strand:- start:2045 stop:2650 length:606 start_codon:yes stop_codon:yes gene_type:complete
MRYFLVIFILTSLGVFLIAGKQGDVSRKPPIEIFDDMVRQVKFRPQQPNRFFENERTSQLKVEGTVARGSAYEDSPVNTGKFGGGNTNFVSAIPIAVTGTLMTRGAERYAISCKVCHGALGDGNGVTKKFGMGVVGNLLDPVIVKQPDGQIFNTITHGRNLMNGYGANITIQDRWAIVAYVRALQRAQFATAADLPAELRK